MLGSWRLFRGARTHTHTRASFSIGKEQCFTFTPTLRSVMFLKAWLDVKGNTVVKMLKSKLHQLDKEQNRHKENKILT